MNSILPEPENSPSDATAASAPSRTLRMTLAYDGTKYCGWQIQPNGVSLQSVVEKALLRFTGEPTKVVASGRTDAGVHALGQVISFSTRSTAPCNGFLHGLAQYLPDDIVVRAVQPAVDEFNARYNAKRKWYRYIIHNCPIRSPFLRNAVLWQRARLDDVAMHQAVQYVIGTHDFRCFETQWPNRSSSVRTVFRAEVTRTENWTAWDSQVVGSGDDEKPFLCFDIEANGFLYNMVRAIVGTLIHIGRGRWQPEEMQRIIDRGDRARAGDTAPPQGLYLMRVDYE